MGYNEVSKNNIPLQTEKFINLLSFSYLGSTFLKLGFFYTVTGGSDRNCKAAPLLLEQNLSTDLSPCKKDYGDDVNDDKSI